MNTSLSAESLEKITGRLRSSMAGFATRYPGESGRRQPVHTVYGGAHLFKSDTTVKLGQLAVRSFESFAPDAATFASALDLPLKLADTIFARVGEKIAREAVEDFRIDLGRPVEGVGAGDGREILITQLELEGAGVQPIFPQAPAHHLR